MRPASQRFFIHSCIFLRILIISHLATFLGTNSLSVLMCRKAINQSTIVTPWVGWREFGSAGGWGAIPTQLGDRGGG